MSTVSHRRSLNTWLWLVVGVLVLGGLGFAGYLAVSEFLGNGDEAVAEPLYIQKRWRDVRESYGHEEHLRQEDITCWSCHEKSPNGGVSRPDASICAGCHENHPASLHAETLMGPANAGCLDCHGFDDNEIKPADRCVVCHETPQGYVRAIKGHGDGKTPCKGCHQPHQVPSLKPKECVDCHEKKIKLRHGRKRKVDKAQSCLACHAVHETKGEPSRRCASCHATSNPRIPPSAVFTGHDGCADCHTAHQFTKTGTAACDSCHDDQKALGARKVRKHRDCKSCHKPHDVRSATETGCRSCHRRVRPRHPKEKGDTCMGCHPAHPKGRGGMLTSATTNCSSCHDKARRETSFHAPGKVKCSECHKPHKFKASSLGCGGCHTEQRSQVARTKKRGHVKCAKCHAKANHNATAPVKQCLSCHAKKRDQAPPKHRKCDECHRTHDGRIKKDCASCHEKQGATAPRGHDKCKTCHRAHRVGVLPKAKRCANCHKKKARAQHGRIKGGCKSCHRAHGPKGIAKPPSCASCHKSRELEGLHKIKKHDRCADCHKTHRAPLTKRANCTAGNCHTKEKTHEPKARSCTGCHPFKK